MTVEIINDINNHLLLDLGNPQASGFIIESITGLGSPDASINMDARAIGNGSRFNSSRGNSRNVVFNLVFDRTTRPIEETRRLCYKIFPIGKKIDMIFSTKNRVCKTSGYVETNEPDIFSKSEGVQISVLCEDAYLQGVSENVIEFSGITSAFEFPFDNNSLSENLIELSNIYMLQECNVENQGDADTGFVMTIDFKEEVSNLTISKENEYGALSVNDFTFTESSRLVLSTINGRRYILVENWGVLYQTVNLLDKMSGSWLMLNRGDNVIKVEGTGLNDSFIQVEFPTLYAGV